MLKPFVISYTIDINLFVSVNIIFLLVFNKKKRMLSVEMSCHGLDAADRN